jgi:hypothetical protein
MTQFSANTIFFGAIPPEGPKYISFAYDFSIQNTHKIDLNLLVQQNNISGIQTVFIDNSLNNSTVSLSVEETQQKIQLGPLQQGFFPMMVTERTSITVTSVSTNSAKIILLNYPMAAGSWNSNTAPSSDVLSPIIVSGRLNVRTVAAQMTDVNRSGTITTGGTAQVLMVANPSRVGWMLQNMDETILEGLWYSTTGTAAPNTPGSFQLNASTGVGFSGGAITGTSSNQISIYAATTGHKFSAVEY